MHPSRGKSEKVEKVGRVSTAVWHLPWPTFRLPNRYLKGTRDIWLAYGGSDDRLEGFTDADGNMAEDRRGTSDGYAFINTSTAALFLGAPRQGIVTLSTTESEYVGAVHATQEAL
jgi:hypothetical protein